MISLKSSASMEAHRSSRSLVSKHLDSLRDDCLQTVFQSCTAAEERLDYTLTSQFGLYLREGSVASRT
jgi:hypothetical protein